MTPLNRRGFAAVAALKPGIVKNAAGDTIWDNDAYAFLKGSAPRTTNANLWRMSQLTRKQGLFKVTDRIHQVRGLDLSNMTIVEGDTGIIVIDPLISAETAAAALELYRDHVADKEVTGLIYTHPHVDHYGGRRGVLPNGAGDVPIIAPEGFMEHAVSENVYAGTAMTRRSLYMYGAQLPKGPPTHVGCGLGQNISTGTIGLYGGQVDVAFASHHWPTWGNEEIVELLEARRDLYAYMHDQTLRILDSGLTAREIAEEFQLPPALVEVWANRGYYGSISNDVKGIYQRYMGWFDGNPAHLWEHPPVAEAKRYVKALGGPESALPKARVFVRDGDLRFAATLLNHCVFAEPDQRKPKELLAQVHEKLAYATENAVWRNFCLTGAMELREGVKAPSSTSDSSDVKAALSVDQLIDAMSVRVDGPKAWDLDLAVAQPLRRADAHHEQGAVVAAVGREGVGAIRVSGDVTLLTTLFSVIVTPAADFPIVTP